MGTRFKDHKYVQKGHFLCAPLFDTHSRQSVETVGKSKKRGKGDKRERERSRWSLSCALETRENADRKKSFSIYPQHHHHHRRQHPSLKKRRDDLRNETL